MKIYHRILLVSILTAFISTTAFGVVSVDDKTKQSKTVKSSTAGCSAASAFAFLDINNCRVRINTGGDMWWDLGAGAGAQYYIPANTTKTALFSGSLWIGGVDVNDQLKLAALRYRQVGNDYWPGPLTVDGTASVEADVCAEFDKFYPISRAEVDEFLAYWASENKAEEFPGYVPPRTITEWPAHGNTDRHQSQYLAPFFDRDGDGEYSPDKGDYPYYDISNELCHSDKQTLEGINGIVLGGILADQVIKGDKTFWWVFNDKGNIHTETKGSAIGLEIRAQAFAFTTNDEINNMTFYSYEIINRSTFTLTQTYFSPWSDTDLGYAWDDYVGCDVVRGMGYCYNGKAIDGAGEIEAYGNQPPAVGIDFFQGPYLDPDGYDNPGFLGDGIYGPSFKGDCSIVNFDSTVITMKYGKDDEFTGSFLVRSEAINGVNFGNGIVDDERFGMRRFVYHNNGGAAYMSDPSIAPEYYNMLRGIWKDGTKMMYGGNAHTSSGAVGPECDFMFPGDTDPCNWGTGGNPPNGGYNQNGLYWTEQTANNNPNDRRFMQSAGPFTLVPGAVNYITFGVPWARAISGGPWASVLLLQVVDDKCQALFDNCFKVLDGPDAPDLTIQELDKELIIYLTNKKISNNYKEGYAEKDITIKTGDSLYRFEGYMVYQLADATVTAESLKDPAKARLIMQSDVRNGITKLVNHNLDQSIGYSVPVVEVVGGDNGVIHSFKVTEDAFATGDRTLVNHKQYYFMAIAYSYNEYKKYTIEPTGLDGQKKPFLSGRKNIRLYTGIPHYTVNGLVMNSSYGSGPEITRLQGSGNGGMSLELTEATIAEILSKPHADSVNVFGSKNYPIAYNPVYKKGYGPLNVRVIDPLNVKKGKFTLTFVNNIADANGLISNASWRLVSEEGQLYRSDTTINVTNEQLFFDLGLAFTINQVAAAGEVGAINNASLESQLIYADSSKRWLSGVYDNNVPSSPSNWIRSGTYKDDENPNFNDWNMATEPAKPFDAGEYYEKYINGMWAPYQMVAPKEENSVGPGYSKIARNTNRMNQTHSVDIVLTADKSKWTRSVVIEMGSDKTLNEGGADRFEIRRSPSVDKNGNKADPNAGPSSNPEDANFISAVGMGWFPGYAIDIETGERLNIMFGEDSWLSGHNGRDMLWNPTSTVYQYGSPVFGGKHYVYVMNHTTINLSGTLFNFPAYDACAALYKGLNTSPIQLWGPSVFASTMWVGMPIMSAANANLWMSTDARFRLRVAVPYSRHYSVALPAGHADSLNNNFPVYGINTAGLEPTFNDPIKAQKDMDIINIVPNPYYAYSAYERNNLDNRVKITNLPKKCTVTIYNMSGTLIRQFTKDDPITSLDWDLKNFAGIPISGGFYLIHIKSDAGERIIKWFGALRPVDLNTF